MEPTKETLRAEWKDDIYGVDIQQYPNGDFDYSGSADSIADWWLSHTLDPQTVLAYIENQKVQEPETCPSIYTYKFSMNDKECERCELCDREKAFNHALELVATFIRSKMKE